LSHMQVLMSILCLWCFEVVKWRLIIRLTHTVQAFHYPPTSPLSKRGLCKSNWKARFEAKLWQASQSCGFLGPWPCIHLLKSLTSSGFAVSPSPSHREAAEEHLSIPQMTQRKQNM
jgi:hypothetical protein